LAINELIGEKSAIKIMDDLTDDWPLTGGGETTFELIVTMLRNCKYLISNFWFFYMPHILE